jgi:hypothetical protein
MLDSRHDEKDAVKVLDFGIAKLRDVVGPRLTGKGMVCGTPGYSSPEQARGEELDPRSDLYSVGVVLYELVSGKLPFEASSPGAMVAKMLVEPPVPLHVRRPDLDVPADLEAVIMRALSPDREARFASAEAFRAELLACGATGERPAASAAAQGTVTVPATAPSPRQTQSPRGTQTAGRTPSGRTAAMPASPRQATARRPTPRQRPAAARGGSAREVVSAVSVIAGSALGALLFGTLVWYGLSWVRASREAPPTHAEATMAK